METHGTVFFGRRQPVPILLLVLAALVKGMGIRAAGRVFGLDTNTVQSWLGAAAEQLSAFASHFLVDLEPQQVQLDEVYASLAHLLESDSSWLSSTEAGFWGSGPLESQAGAVGLEDKHRLCRAVELNDPKGTIT